MCYWYELSHWFKKTLPVISKLQMHESHLMLSLIFIVDVKSFPLGFTNVPFLQPYTSALTITLYVLVIWIVSLAQEDPPSFSKLQMHESHLMLSLIFIVDVKSFPFGFTNVPFLQPYPSALIEIWPCHDFGWKRMNRALKDFTSRCSTTVCLSLLPEKTFL